MSPPSRISREDAGRAIDALLGFLRSRSKHLKSQLFEPDDFIFLHLSLLRFPSSSRLNPHRIPLPHSLHPLHPSRTSLCLIAGDSSSAASARSAAAANNLPFDSVIPISDLRADYLPFESRRRLCDSYDVFFADRRIVTLLPRLIGKYFFKKKKIPLAVNLSRPGWPEAVREACRSTLLFVREGTGVGMKVGRVSMDREAIVDNLMAALEGAVARVPRKWRNVRCVYVKAVQSAALMIYQVVPEMGMRIDVGAREEAAEGLDGEKRGGSQKKRKGRIHDVGYVGGELVDGSEEENGEVEMVEEEKKDGKRKVRKGKKGRRGGDEGEEKGRSGEFIELDAGRKKRKRPKKIADSEVEEHWVKDGSAVDVAPAAGEDDRDGSKELLLKKKVKGKGKKGKKRLVS